MIENIKALLKKPGEVAKPVMVANDLSAFQGLVGGYIEVTPLGDRMVIICNEDGWALGLKRNVKLWGNTFVGPILICGVDGEEFSDVPMAKELLQVMFPQLWEVQS